MFVTCGNATVHLPDGADNHNMLRGLDRTVHTVNMSPKQTGTLRGPGPKELEKYLEKGMTQQQIADAWEEATNVRVSRSTIGMAIARYGLESPHPRPRYENMLPWRVVAEHRMAYDARMLRAEGRRREGKSLTTKEKRLLTAWREQLDDSNAVIVYDPDTAEGFFWVPREEDDDDIIRRGRV